MFKSLILALSMAVLAGCQYFSTEKVIKWDIYTFTLTQKTCTLDVAKMIVEMNGIDSSSMKQGRVEFVEDGKPVNREMCYIDSESDKSRILVIDAEGHGGFVQTGKK